jgi:hypothetical protein
MSVENIEKLREKVALLEKRVEFFKERVERARWLSEMLVRAKAPHPRFPYWEWEFKNISTETMARNLHRVTTTLSFRVEGTWEFDESCKDVPGIVSEELYQSRPPTREEVYAFVKIAGGFTYNAQVTEMFVARRMNGHQDPLIDFVLAQ